MLNLQNLLDQVSNLTSDMTDLSKYYAKGYEPRVSEDANVLTLFMSKANRFRRLTREEERELSIRKVSGDKKALQILILTNLKLVLKIAHDFKNKGVDLEDLVSEGLFGLIKGIEKYNPACAKNNNAKLSTYAAWWIKQSMHRSIANHSKLIRIPVQSANNIRKIKKAKAAITNNFESDDVLVISDKTGLSKETVKNLEHVATECVSLDAIISDSDTSYLEYFEAGNLSTEIDNKDTINRLYAAISTLSPREQIIIKERFGLITGKKKSLTELEPIIGRTRERIRQLEKKAMEKLRGIIMPMFKQNPAYDLTE